MLVREANLENADSHIFKIVIYFIVHLPISTEYTFRVSPSRMDRDNSKSKGLGTLLHVIKREPKDLVSSLKEFMELAFC